MIFPDKKGTGTKLSLTNAEPTAIRRVGAGTIFTVQYDVPKGYIVRVSATTEGYGNIPDVAETDSGYLDPAFLERQRAKGRLAEFYPVMTLTGRGFDSSAMAINGLKFDLISEDEAAPQGDDEISSLPTEAVEPSQMDWNALRNLAKSLGINTMGKQREVVEQAVLDALVAKTEASVGGSGAVAIPVAGLVTASISFASK